MIGNLKREWRELRKGRPGHRFRAQFERSKRARSGKSLLRRCIPIFAGSVLLFVGLILLLIPGPGIPFLIVGAGMLAKQFRPAAVALDWLEINLRNLTRLGMAWWRQASIPDKSAAALLVAMAIAGMGYGAFHVILGD